MPLDDVDRQILHILTLQPRASFRAIAEVAGISDQTAARRYRRLSENAGLRVLGVLDGAQLGRVEWFLRLQTTPGGADSIAEALARRPDTKWVRLASGGTEIICVVEAHDPEQRDALFLRGLPGSRRVVQISAHSILHDFSPGPWRAHLGTLSDAQLAALSPVTDPLEPLSSAPGDPLALERAHPSRRTPVGPGDEPLLAELARDGRASHAALAAAIHWHESTVRRRMDELRQAGLLVFEIDLDDRALGSNVPAMFWLSVEPSRLDPPPPPRDRPGPGGPSRDPLRRRDDRAHQPGRQRPVPRYPASLRVPHR
jgi:DNA-binding Lrp family transcriptional regulator